MNKVAILQPSYLPWIGYFEQIASVDNFVFYDDVQYTKNDWRHRNKIKAQNTSLWLSVPVHYSSQELINHVKVDDTKKWRVKHIKTLKQYYGKTPYFQEVFPLLEKHITDFSTIHLSTLCIALIQDIANYLEIRTQFHLASQLQIEGDKNSRLLNICNHFNADIYYCGAASQNYLDTLLFKQHNIDVTFQEYQHPIYKQVGDNFVPYLSIVDLLFNCGKNSLTLLKGK